jgi:dimethylaniline monooxygenase (N-oxide forming)
MRARGGLPRRGGSPPMSQDPPATGIEGRVAVIGAGSSGLAACRVLHQRKLPFDCFEKGSDVGGLWRYENDNGLACAYASLHLNTSRNTAQYTSYPMPEHYPDFPHHSQMLAYFEDYAEHFSLREHIRFRTEVTATRRVEDGWEVQWRDADGTVQSDRYAAVLIASGHHWDPRKPEPLPGSFGGREIHSCDYRTAHEFEGMNVLVVGLGDSALDIASDTSRSSKMTFLTARRGAWLLPKTFGSRPLGEVAIGLMSRSPIAGEVAGGPLFKLTSTVFSRWNNLQMGRPESHGLPKPDHRFGTDIAAVASDVLTRIGYGRVTPKPWISHTEGERVHFQDGSAEKIDVIVYCTGYNIALPFLAYPVVDADGTVPLYKRVVHPDLPGLYFVGLIDVAGPLNPLAELQAEWIADLLEGSAQLPSSPRMRAAIAHEDRRRQKRFGTRGRHAIFVDYAPYRLALRRELRGAHSSQRKPVAAGVGASGLAGSPSTGTGSL